MKRFISPTSVLLSLLVVLSISCSKDSKSPLGPGDTTVYHDITFNTIPGGSFRMGDIQNFNEYSQEKPVHDVTLSGFEMSIYEITQGQYESIIGSNPSKNTGVGADYPVYYVSWYDAATFCNRLSEQAGYDKCYTESGNWECDFSKNGFRLPTEAEWEYACRAGTDTYFHTGNELSSDGSTSADLDKAGWYWFNLGNSSFTSHIVGAKEPNVFGLYDMHGNMWEWCNDWYGESYYSSSPRVTLLVQIRALTVWYVAAAGATLPGSAGRRAIT